MIKLNKISKPHVLEENDNAWTQEYLHALELDEPVSATIKYRYKHPEIKQALIDETHGKCAYCESKILHVEFGDIDHILPKNREARPDLYVNWSNLTLSCELCNRKGKRDYYDENTPLINPYLDDPDEYFLEVGVLICSKNCDNRSIITLKILDLNRAELIERKIERLKQIELLYEQWKKCQNDKIKSLLYDELIGEFNEDKEFASTVKSFLLTRGFPIYDH